MATCVVCPKNCYNPELPTFVSPPHTLWEWSYTDFCLFIIYSSASAYLILFSLFLISPKITNLPLIIRRKCVDYTRCCSLVATPANLRCKLNPTWFFFTILYSESFIMAEEFKNGGTSSSKKVGVHPVRKSSPPFVNLNLSFYRR